MAEWLKHQTSNLTNTSHMGSNPVMVRPLFLRARNITLTAQYRLVPGTDSNVYKPIAFFTIKLK